MPSKTRTRTTRTTATTGTARALRPVPDQPTTTAVRTDTEDKLWAALHAHPHNTAPFLAGTARIGRSTAQKILAHWADDGSVTRTPGIAEGGRRAADVWAIAKVDATDAAVDAVPEKTEPADAAPASTEAATSADGAPPNNAMQTASGDGKDGKSDRLVPGALRGMVEDHLRDHPVRSSVPPRSPRPWAGNRRER
ncbi:hypothetical protein EV192_102991 [Actinocrispum wychmicini]|uniref:Uncharacterized protein n=2 Tax=Actinocrispum wychmicini TaxID=1213861 RepID=A0A4R2JUY1_9PSEU|nr:hypothetical protein EV192_102991 [Actinocrispum wychmicini]